MAIKQSPPTSVRLDKEDKKALALLIKLFSRPGMKVDTTKAIKIAIHTIAEKIQTEQQKKTA